jgi:hypothetical protein
MKQQAPIENEIRFAQQIATTTINLSVSFLITKCDVSMKKSPNMQFGLSNRQKYIENCLFNLLFYDIIDKIISVHSHFDSKVRQILSIASHKISKHFVSSPLLYEKMHPTNPTINWSDQKQYELQEIDLITFIGRIVKNIYIIILKIYRKQINDAFTIIYNCR